MMETSRDQEIKNSGFDFEMDSVGMLEGSTIAVNSLQINYSGVIIAVVTAVIARLKEGWMDSLRKFFLGVVDGIVEQKAMDATYFAGLMGELAEIDFKLDTLRFRFRTKND